jgi:hypothetical protein
MQLSSLRESYDHPKNIRLMMKLGIIGPDTDEADVFLRWGSLISDPQYFQSHKDLHEYVAGLSAPERIALRDSVCGVKEIKPAA